MIENVALVAHKFIGGIIGIILLIFMKPPESKMEAVTRVVVCGLSSIILGPILLHAFGWQNTDLMQVLSTSSLAAIIGWMLITGYSTIASLSVYQWAMLFNIVRKGIDPVKLEKMSQQLALQEKSQKISGKKQKTTKKQKQQNK